MHSAERVSFIAFLVVGVGCLFVTFQASAQTPLGTEFRFNSNTAVAKNYPKVAVAKGATFQVVWQAGGFPSDDIYHRRFSTSGAPLTNDNVVNLQSLAGEQSYPSIASLNASGAFVVVWRASVA